MSKPLTISLQLAALVFLVRAHITDTPELYLLAAVCFFPAAIAIRKRLKG